MANPVSIVLGTDGGVLNLIYPDYQDCTNCDPVLGKECVGGTRCFKRGLLTGESNFIIYLSWIGTDAYGHHFVSHTLRLNKLSPFSQNDIYGAALNLY
jgi:hypothetical protein